MSSGAPLRLENARRVANHLVEVLTPVTERIQIVGSVRRGEMTVHDIEILMIAKMGKGNAVGLFEELAPDVNLAVQKLDEMVETGQLTKRLNSLGHTMWGNLNQYALFGSTPVDFFQCPTPEQWGVYCTVRTGPADFSKAVMTQRRFEGHLPNGMYVKDWRVFDGDEVLDTPEEADFFRILGFPDAIDPDMRRDIKPIKQPEQGAFA